MRPSSFLHVVLLAGLLLPAPLLALVPEVRAARPSSPVRIDGVLDEAAWATAGVVPDLVQQSPVAGGPTPYRTEVRILADASGLTLGFVLVDPEPERVAIHTMLRDGDMSGDDQVTVVLDTFGDGRNAYFFRFNAAGARADGLVSNADTATTDWDGLWTVAARRTPSGWSAEMHLPSRSVAFRKGLAAWGLNFDRYVPRGLINFRWVGTTLDSRLWDLSRAGRLTGLADLEQGLGLSATPYALGRRTDAAGGAGATLKGTAGVDVGWSPSPDLQSVVTVNTDFAETDVDTRQINLTRFPLFFPEKRAFFLEGSNLFTFGLGLGDAFVPFYSRRVGLHAGQTVPIAAGAKVVVRSGPVAFAALDVLARGTELTDRANLFAGRLTWDADPHLRVGALVTDGDPSGRRSNTLAGVDAVWQTSTFAGGKNLAVGAFWAGSRGDLPDGRSTGWGLKVDYPNDLFTATAQVNELGEALSPALGFLPRPGTRQWLVSGGYNPRPRTGPLASFVHQLFFSVEGDLVTDLAGAAQSWEVDASPVNVRFRSGDRAYVIVQSLFERLDAPFEVAHGVVIPPGDYRFFRSTATASTAAARSWQAGTTVAWGTFYSGTLTTVSGFLAWSNGAGHLQLRLSGLENDGRLPEGSFVQQLWQLSTTYAVDPDLVLSANGQYDTVSRNLGLFARLRFTPVPGRDLILVWNHAWQETEATGQAPSSLRFLSDELVVKLRLTFRG